MPSHNVFVQFGEILASSGNWDFLSFRIASCEVSRLESNIREKLARLPNPRNTVCQHSYT
jgi:hypothetical protein